MNYNKYRYVIGLTPDDIILLYNGLKIHFADTRIGQRRALCNSPNREHLTKDRALIRCNDCETLVFRHKLRK